MDNKTLVWQTIRGFKVQNYPVLWHSFIKQLPNITANELDSIILQLSKEGKVDIFPPNDEDTQYLVNKGGKYVGEWAIIG